MTEATTSGQEALSQRIADIVLWFEQLTPTSLSNIDRIYAPAARFIDPFNDVTGVRRVEAVYRHMFATLEAPRFVVETRMGEGRNAFLVWRCEFALRGTPRCIRGASHLLLDEHGLIVSHVDYWDAAAQVYEQLPVLGSVLRWIKQRLAI